MLSRPTVDVVGAYRDHVGVAMAAFHRAGRAPGSGARRQPLLELGVHHEQQHQELILMDIKHVFSINPLLPAYQAPQPRQPVSPPPLAWVEFAGGLDEIGDRGPGFAFDNETPRHQVWLEPFRLAARPGDAAASISNSSRMAATGAPEFWLSDGWATVRGQGWEAPHLLATRRWRLVGLHAVRRASL